MINSTIPASRIPRHTRLFALAGLVALLAGCAAPGMRGGIDVDGLRNAIVADHVDYVRQAVAKGVINVNQRIPAPVYMEGTPLITIAARAGSVGVLDYLIRTGADLDARTPANETALMLAAYFRNEEAGSGSASFARHEKAARMLVEAGAHIENEQHNYTPLSYAAYQGHDHMIRYLLGRGARVNGDAENGIVYINTPLMMAAMQGNATSALLLLRAGADARVRVHGGHTAAELAVKYKGDRLVPMLRCAEKLRPGERFSPMCDGVPSR
jgi:hypothetical protein